MAAGYAWEISAGSPTVDIMYGALVPFNLTHDISLGVPVWLTPVTALGLHAGLWHLASNALVLLAVGPAVAERCGGRHFIIFFVCCGIAGALAQVALDPGSHRPIIGASGAIAGVLGAYLMRFPLQQTIAGVPAAVPILLWAVLQCIQSGVLYSITGGTAAASNAPIAYAAHVGGFILGACTFGLFEYRA